MAQSMKAVVVTAPQHFEVRDLPVPDVGPGQVLVRMMAAGVCGSDHHLPRQQPLLHHRSHKHPLRTNTSCQQSQGYLSLSW
jgi:NADPH:quinone reductase-like Zn-dependent oxidoreductase